MTATTMAGGAFLLQETLPEEVWTPEEFTAEQREPARAAEAFVHGWSAR